MDAIQYEVKTTLNDLVPHGARQEIAQGSGITAGAISRQFNPCDELKSPIAETIKQLIEMKRFAPVACEAIRLLIDDLVDSEPCESRQTDTAQLMSAVAKETTDSISAELERKPMCCRRVEGKEMLAAASAYNRHLRQKVG